MNTTTDNLHESIQSNLRRECLISARHQLKGIVRDLDQLVGTPAHDAALSILRALGDVERLEREVRP